MPIETNCLHNYCNGCFRVSVSYVGSVDVCRVAFRVGLREPSDGSFKSRVRGSLLAAQLVEKPYRTVHGLRPAERHMRNARASQKRHVSAHELHRGLSSGYSRNPAPDSMR